MGGNSYDAISPGVTIATSRPFMNNVVVTGTGRYPVFKLEVWGKGRGYFLDTPEVRYSPGRPSAT